MSNEADSRCPYSIMAGIDLQGRSAGLAIPFEPLEKISVSVRKAIEAEALRANDRYVLEFLEKYAFCPFANAGRKEGRSTRKVFCFDGQKAEDFIELLKEVALDEEKEVTQVIFPMLKVEPQDWHHFCQSLTAHESNRIGGKKVLAVAPLHPKLSYSPDNSNTLLTLFRRTPDPTIQWVRLDALASIYEGRDGEKTFVAPEDIPRLLAESQPSPDLYARIAETNSSMAHRMGLSKVEELLEGFFLEAQGNYRKILAESEGG